MFSHVESVTLVTFNIRNTTDRYDERKHMLREIFHEMQSSSAHEGSNYLICGLQEVRFISTNNYLNQIEELLPIDSIPLHQVYPTHLTQPYLSDNDFSFRIDGNCIFVVESNSPKIFSPMVPISSVSSVSFVKILSHDELILSSVRNAQRLVLSLPYSNVIISFTNVHLHHLLTPSDTLIRLDQIQKTLEWIQEHDTRQSVAISIFVGDFNCSPQEIGYHEILAAGYHSAYSVTHGGQEPSLTFPTGLQAPTMDTDGPITCDYIFLKNSTLSTVPVRGVIDSCELFGHLSHPQDSTLYPSDHVGVRARLKVEVCREEEA